MAFLATKGGGGSGILGLFGRESCAFPGLFGCSEFGVFDDCLVLELENLVERDVIVERVDAVSGSLNGSCSFVLGQDGGSGVLSLGEKHRMILIGSGCSFVNDGVGGMNEYLINISYSWLSNRAVGGVIEGRLTSQSSSGTSGGVCEASLSGVCGNALDSCAAGAYRNLSAGWSCDGLRGGRNVSCKVVEGICDVGFESCQAGAFRDILDNTTHYLWSCKGLSGGIDADNCSLERDALTPSDPSCTPIDGGWSDWGVCYPSSSGKECGSGFKYRACASPTSSCGGRSCVGSNKLSCVKGCGPEKTCSSGRCITPPPPPPPSLSPPRRICSWYGCFVECGSGTAYRRCYNSSDFSGNYSGETYDCWKGCGHPSLVCSNGTCVKRLPNPPPLPPLISPHPRELSSGICWRSYCSVECGGWGTYNETCTDGRISSWSCFRGNCSDGKVCSNGKCVTPPTPPTPSCSPSCSDWGGEGCISGMSKKSVESRICRRSDCSTYEEFRLTHRPHCS